MSEDVVETFRAMKEESALRRAENRANSARLLNENHVPFVSKNGGAHLVVGEPDFADFWPGTGLWIVRGSGVKGRGVFRLLKAMGKKPA